MKQKTRSKAFEFFALFTTVVGMVIGVGIYFKIDNGKGHILGSSQNPIMAIVLWIIVAFLSITMIMVFVEIATSSKDNECGNLSNWFTKFINRKCGSLVTIFNLLVYMPVMYSVMAFLVIEFIFVGAEIQIAPHDKLLVQVFGSMGVMILFALINIFSRNMGKWIQVTGFCIKFIPLIIALFIGFIKPAGNNVFSNGSYQSWKVNNFFITIAPILFSIDGFINAANLRKEVIHKQNVSKALFIGMVFIALFYIAISVSLFLGTNDGSFFTLFEKTIGGWFTKVLFAFIVISAILAMNGWTYTANGYFSSASDSKLLFVKKHIPEKLSGFIQLICGLIWFLILLLIGYFIDKNNPNLLMDQFSNIVVVMQFSLYCCLIIATMVNRKTKKVKIEKIKLFWGCSIIAVSILTIFISYIIYSIFADVSSTKWIFLGSLITIGGCWVGNEYLMVKNNKKLELSKSIKND